MPQTKILLDESDIPTHWYNVVADMPNKPAPSLGPDGNPVGPDKMLAIFPMSLLEQEMSGERWIPIPEPVREAYRLWRPSPLVRATAVVGLVAYGTGNDRGAQPLGTRERVPGIHSRGESRESGCREDKDAGGLGADAPQSRSAGDPGQPAAGLGATARL